MTCATCEMPFVSRPAPPGARWHRCPECAQLYWRTMTADGAVVGIQPGFTANLQAHAYGANWEPPDAFFAPIPAEAW